MIEFLNADTLLEQNAGAGQLVKHDFFKLEFRRFEPRRLLHYAWLIRIRLRQRVRQTESTSMLHKLVEIFSYPLYKPRIIGR